MVTPSRRVTLCSTLSTSTAVKSMTPKAERTDELDHTLFLQIQSVSQGGPISLTIPPCVRAVLILHIHPMSILILCCVTACMDIVPPRCLPFFVPRPSLPCRLPVPLSPSLHCTCARLHPLLSLPIVPRNLIPPFPFPGRLSSLLDSMAIFPGSRSSSFPPSPRAPPLVSFRNRSMWSRIRIMRFLQCSRCP
jgi:hypothetical protein